MKKPISRFVFIPMHMFNNQLSFFSFKTSQNSFVDIKSTFDKEKALSYKSPSKINNPVSRS